MVGLSAAMRREGNQRGHIRQLRAEGQGVQGVAVERRQAGDGQEHKAETPGRAVAGSFDGGPHTHAQAFTSDRLMPWMPAGRLVATGQSLWEEERQPSLLCLPP